MGSYDDWGVDLTPARQVTDAQRAALPWIRDVNTLSVAELARRSRAYGHGKRPPLVIEGQTVKETLKQKLTREAAEAEDALVAITSRLSVRRKQLAHLERYPDEDPFKDGTTLIFQKSFPNSDTKYSYSAVRADDAWYITGNRSPQGITWDEFVSWMGLGVDEVYRVTPANASVKKVIG